MRTQTGLVRRRGSSAYYLRIRVPADLLSHYRKREVRFSLGTSDKREARARAEAERARIFREFDALRRGVAPPEARSALSPAEVQHLTSAWLAAQLATDHEGRAQGAIDPDRLAASLDDGEDAVRMALADGAQEAGLAPEIAALLRAHGLSVPVDSPAWRSLSYALAEAGARLNAALRARSRGELAPTPAHPGPLLRGESLTDLFAYWKSQAPRRERTVSEFAAVVRAFERMHPGVPARSLTRAHVVAFRDALLKDRSQRTVKKALSLLAAIMQTAVDGERLPVNVARTVKVARMKVEQRARIAFAPADLARLFSSPVFTDGERPRGGAGEFAFWAPLLALHSGARLGEVGQLLASDVRLSDDGIAFLAISDESEGQAVRTESSRRAVPLHPTVLGLGFLSYVELRRKEGPHARLFPLLKPDAHGVITGSFSKWFGRYLRAVGVTDRRVVFHSFRHAFKQACRDASVPEELHDALTGHAGNGGVGRTYGSVGLGTLAAAVSRIKFALPEISAPSYPQS